MLVLLALIGCVDVVEPASVEEDPPSTPEEVPEAPEPTRVAHVRINELMASNARAWVDPSGAHPDWIELHNAGAEAARLDGWSLVDGVDADGTSAPLAGVEVPAGGFVVLIADGVDAPGHLPFELDADGGGLGLWWDGAPVDRVVWGRQLRDASFGRYPDGASRWALSTTATPGEAGVATPALASPGEIRPADGQVQRTQGACRPLVSPGRARVEEGDRVELSLDCATGATPAEVRWVGDVVWDAAGPDGARWTPGPAAAGVRDGFVEVLSAGDPMPELAPIVVEVADGWAAPNNQPVDPARYATEWGLPVLHLQPTGDLSEAYTPMQAWWGGERFEGQIKIRGAASVSYPKNSYTLEFDPVSLPIDGRPDKDQLVLISDFDDNSYARQQLVFEAWERMAQLDGEPRIVIHPWKVVVYLRGVYHGLYTAVDHVDDELIAELGFDPTGNLYKSVSHEANFYRTDPWGGEKWWLGQGWEKKEGEPEDDYSDLEAFTWWCGGLTPRQFADEAPSQLSVQEIMDWFLLVHHMAANDSAGKNAYFYNETALGTWWRYAPWDFNHALGQDWQTYRTSPEEYTDFKGSNAMFRHIQDHPPLDRALWDRYAQHRAPGGALALDRLLANLDQILEVSGDAARRDWGKWEGDHRAYWGFRNDIGEHADEVDLVRQWITDRDAFMTSAHGPPGP